MAVADSRAALLAAAWDITGETFGLARSKQPSGPHEPAKLFGQLKTAEVARRAGLSTGAFYNRWPTRDAFLDEFLDYALSIDRYPSPSSLFQVFSSVIDQQFPHMVEALAEANVAKIENNPTHAIQRHLWSYCKDRDDIAARLQRLYREGRDRMIPFYEVALAQLGREMRPPFTLQSGASLLNAMMDGIIGLRAPGGTDAPPAELFAWGLMALVPSLTRPIGDRRDLQAFVMSEVPVGEMSLAGRRKGAHGRSIRATVSQ